MSSLSPNKAKHYQEYKNDEEGDGAASGASVRDLVTQENAMEITDRNTWGLFLTGMSEAVAPPVGAVFSWG